VDVRRCPPRVALTVVKTVVRRASADIPAVAMMSSTDVDLGTRSPVAPTRFHEEAMLQATLRLHRNERDCCQDKSSTGCPSGLLPILAFVRDPKVLVILVVLTGRT
jgi:hypothetical protein